MSDSDSTVLWNVTVDDTSPVLLYQPYSDGIDVTNGWSQWFTGSGGGSGYITSSGNSPGESGQEGATSMHITSLPNASVELPNFFGTMLYIYGSANCTYGVTLDGHDMTFSGSPSNDPALLFSTTNMTSGFHNVTVTAKPTSSSQQLAVDQFIVTSVLSDSTLPKAVVYDNSDTSALYYEGDWTTMSDHDVPNSSDPKPYHQTQALGASVTLSFTNASAVAINGSTNYGNYLYNTTLNGRETTLNGSTWWKIPNALLFYEGNLDPKTTYNVTLTNDAGGMFLKLNSFTVFQPGDSEVSSSLSSSGTATSSVGSASETPITGIGKSSKSKAGTIAGAVVGTLVGVALLTLALLWFWRRKRANSPKWDSVPAPARPMSEIPPNGVLANSTSPISPNRPEQTPALVALQAELGQGVRPTFARDPSSKSGLLADAPAETLRALPMVPSNPSSTQDTSSNPEQNETTAPQTVASDTEDPFTTPENIDRIVELVARRIDPQRHDGNASSPPAYRDA